MSEAGSVDFTFLDRDAAIHNIVKVNHAGEYGAIRIYRGQLLVARLLHKELVPTLREFLSHEEAHFRAFDALAAARAVRRCSAVFLWGLGGWALGVLTALLGSRAIMACTTAVEDTVDRHLAGQIAFLAMEDPELCQCIQSIRAEEQLHRNYASARSEGAGVLMRSLDRCIRSATESVIWISMRL